VASTHAPPAHEFRLAARYRRAAWLVLPIATLLRLSIGVDDWLRGVLGLGAGPGFLESSLNQLPVVVLATLPVLCTTLWRIRVDERGVAARRLFGWELWPWSAFEGGQVDRGGPAAYELERPDGGLRVLTLFPGMMEESERELLDQILRSRWVPPKLDLPVELTIDLIAPRRTLRLAPDGLRLEQRSESRWLPWADVQGLRVWRVDREQRGFNALEMTLSDGTVLRIDRKTLRPINGKHVKLVPNSRIRSINEFLMRRVPPDRVLILAIGDHPRSLAEARVRLAEVEKGFAELRRYARRGTLYLSLLFILPIILASISLLLDIYLIIVKGWRFQNIGPNRDMRFVPPLVLMTLGWLALRGIYRSNSRLTRERLESERSRLVEWARATGCALA
jgi:hypothetical protein